MIEPWESLRQAGWPVDYLSTTVNSSKWVGKDLFERIRSAAELASACRRPNPRQQRFLQRLQTPGGSATPLTWGWPGASSLVTARLQWWSAAPPKGRRVAVLSSRLGRRLEDYSSWFEAVRTLCAGLDPGRRLLLTCESMSADPFLRYAGHHFGLSTIVLQLPPARQKLATWLRQFERGSAWPTCEGAQWRVRLSPCLPGVDNIPTEECPLADWLVGNWAEELYVLHVRPKGQLRRLLLPLLQTKLPTQRMYVSLQPRAIPSRLREQLLAQGALGWQPASGQRHSAPTQETVTQTDRRITMRSIRSLAEVPDGDWSYLVHWTRRQSGPWPDQSEQDYIRELLSDPSAADRSATAALQRIVSMQRIVATNRLTRGPIHVVCLSERRLQEFAHHRTFRRHQQRWDFAPYGICIDRHWLIQHGARPVVYGDDRLWNQLPIDVRPFFQLAKTRSMCGAAPIDWTTEREWRIVGDVDLSQLPELLGLVFVPTQEDAHWIAQCSRWPLTVIE